MKKLINTRPIVFAALCLSLGIVIGYLSFTSRAWHFVTAILVIVCVYCAAKFYKKDFNKLVLALVCLMAYLVGTLLIFAKINTYLSAKSFDGNLYTVTGVVGSVDRLGGDLIGLTLNNIKLGYKSVKYHIYVITSVQNIKVGDSILTSVRLTFSALDSKSLAQFTPLSTYAGDVMVTGENVDAFYKLFNLIKSKILSNLDGDNGAMALALLLGDTSYLTQGAKAAYKLSGVSHIFSVSGLHVVFFSTMVGALLRLVKVKGGYFVVLSFVITLCYAGVCGFPVPAIRAVIMTLILNFAKAFGRKNDSLNSIFLSLIVVLLIYPHNLFSYGLILSYFAFNHSYISVFKSLGSSGVGVGSSGCVGTSGVGVGSTGCVGTSGVGVGSTGTSGVGSSGCVGTSGVCVGSTGTSGVGVFSSSFSPHAKTKQHVIKIKNPKIIFFILLTSIISISLNFTFGYFLIKSLHYKC